TWLRCRVRPRNRAERRRNIYRATLGRARRVIRLRHVALVAVCVFFFAPRAAWAVDRTVGANVPKPPLTGQPWSGGGRASLASGVDALLDAAPALRGAHVSLLAVDARTGASVYERRPDDPVMPASTLKLLTGSVALETVGPAFHFHTEVTG